MIRCSHCGAENYAIDMWCAKCSHHLEWAPPAVASAAPAAEAAAPAAEAVPVVAAAALEPEGAPELPATEEAPPLTAPAAEALPATAPLPKRRRTAVWILPVAAAAIVAVLLALPVAGWFKTASQPAAPRLPLTGALFTATPAATGSPTPSATASPAPTPVAPSDQAPVAAQPVQQQPVPVPASQTTVGDPTRPIASFYQAVAAHQFDAAAATWSAQMQANYPPAEFINQRFAYTQQMNLRVARVLTNNGQVATVYIDLIEVYAGSTRHWVGTWQLVSTSSGWLLNQPNLRAA